MKFIENKKPNLFLLLLPIIIIVGFNILYLISGESNIPINIFFFISLLFGASVQVNREIRFRRRVKYLMKTLYVDLDVDKFINKTQEMINKYNYRDNIMKSSFYSLITFGYAATGNFKECIDIYENKTIFYDKPINKAILYNNLIIDYIEVGNLEKAISIYNEGKEYINMYIADSKLSASLMRTKGIIEYLKGNLTEAEELLVKSKNQKICKISFHCFCKFILVKNLYKN